MNNYVKPGEIVTFTPPVGGVVSGPAYLITDLFVVATGTVTAAEALAGTKAEGLVEGVVTLPKVTSETWVEGAPIYWDVAEAKCTQFDESGANVHIGVAVLVNSDDTIATSGDTTGAVRLHGATLPRVDFPAS